MKDNKKVIPSFICRQGLAIIRDNGEEYYSENAVSLARYYSDNGADGLLLIDGAMDEADHENNVRLLKQIGRSIDVPFYAGGYVRELEDVKKYLYAGAKAVYLDMSREDNVDLLKEASDRFGSEKIYAYLNQEALLTHMEEFSQLGASAFLVDVAGIREKTAFLAESCTLPLFLMNDDDSIGTITSFLKIPSVAGVVLTVPGEKEGNSMEMKRELWARGIPVELLESSISWSEMKTGADGCMPVVVQDYRTQEVLMFGYMNEEAFAQTLSVGKMTYYNKDSQSLWQKGEVSGHFQYVKSLTLDNDMQTILAKVAQIGNACSTGEHSCFIHPAMKKDYRDGNPLKAFEEVYRVISDRKRCPKEGSYTNYLMDKGMDKILKKIGEGSAKLIIASKNPNADEIKCEISDFLYHVMVLMAEKGIHWEEITEELMRREQDI